MTYQLIIFLQTRIKGVYEDAKSALDYLHSRKDINKNKIILYGHSLGGAVALHTGRIHVPRTCEHSI